MSIELRGSIWHVRYRLNGKQISESTGSRDRAVAEELDIRRANELLELKARMRSRALIEPNQYGGVYFVLSKASGLVKIGFSDNTDKRIKSLSTQSGNDLETLVVVQCRNYKEVEIFVHKKWRLNRIRGEWFKFDGMDLARAIGDACRVAVNKTRTSTERNRANMAPRTLANGNDDAEKSTVSVN